MPTPDEIAEAVAKAMYAVEHRQIGSSKWDEESPDIRDYWLVHADAAIKAYRQITNAAGNPRGART